MKTQLLISGILLGATGLIRGESNVWEKRATVDVLRGRAGNPAVWTGQGLFLWGGVNDAQARGVADSSRYVGTGGCYNPATDTWRDMAENGAPSPRLTSGVWAGLGLLTFGVYNGTHLNDTFFYLP